MKKEYPITEFEKELILLSWVQKLNDHLPEDLDNELFYKPIRKSGIFNRA